MEGRARAMTKPPPRRACASRPVVASRYSSVAASVPCQVTTELLQRLVVVVVVVASGAREAASAAAPAVGVRVREGLLCRMEALVIHPKERVRFEHGIDVADKQGSRRAS
jgi:hypothetical protein